MPTKKIKKLIALVLIITITSLSMFNTSVLAQNEPAQPAQSPHPFGLFNFMNDEKYKDAVYENLSTDLQNPRIIVKSKSGEILSVIDLSKIQSEKLVVIKDSGGNILQYIEFESLNPANLKMAIKDKDKNLLQTIEINSQTQQTVVKDKMGVVQFTSQIEEDKVIVRDAQGNILKETPKSEIQSQMPDMSLSQLPATSTLPLALNPSPSFPSPISPSFPSSGLGTQMELPPYLRQQMNRPKTLAQPSDTIPEWNPDFILNSTFTSCCGCNWCGCGGTGGSCVDPNIKCGGPPPPPTDPCNDPCAPPPNTGGTQYIPECRCPAREECYQDCVKDCCEPNIAYCSVKGSECYFACYFAGPPLTIPDDETVACQARCIAAIPFCVLHQLSVCPLAGEACKFGCADGCFSILCN